MNKNYVIYHSHSDISNLTASTGADSITKYTDYLDYAQELGMSAFGLSEHGSVMNWVSKKHETEKRGMKYLHSNEIYLTEGISTDEDGNLVRIRDNYHFLLMAKNFDGVKEINQLTSDSYNREDGHFYHNPRITFDELKDTSDNIIMTSACLASPINRLYNQAYGNEYQVDKDAKRKLDDLLNWMAENKHRMFFEIQYHNHPDQIRYNQVLMRLSRSLDIPLIAGSDTHALNQQHAKVREAFLRSRGADYGDESSFDLTMKSYDEFVDMFKKQDAIPEPMYMEAIHNTNVMADMVEEFELDSSPKYPKLHDEPIKIFKEEINKGVVERGISELPQEEKEVYFDRIKEEFDTYVELDTVNYMLLQKDIIDWCQDNEIYHGYGRGSVNGSLIAYLLGITDMDSVEHDLSFYRFLNPERVSLADNLNCPLAQ